MKSKSEAKIDVRNEKKEPVIKKGVPQGKEEHTKIILCFLLSLALSSF